MKAAAILGAVAFLFTSDFARIEDHTVETADYLKSAIYYSDGWVINFWNSKSRHMDQELARIVRDDFNSITLAAFWRRFQSGVPSCICNQYAWDKLGHVMGAAVARGLSMMLKAGYAWDCYKAGNVIDRYQGLMQEGTGRSVWLKYVGRLYQVTSSHENLCGGFLTWEDFWNFTDASASLGKGVKGRGMTRDRGHVDHARENYKLEGPEEMYGHKLSDYDDLYFPAKGSQVGSVFYGFYDQSLNELLADNQIVLPGLSMEVRLDVDPMKHKDGSREGFTHSSIFPSGSTTHTSTMYGIPIGFIDEHERVTVAEVLGKVPVFLNRLHVYSGGKPVYLDQLLLTDNTVGYEHNAQLQDDEKSLYLEGVVPILRNSIVGYGMWTYRDCGDNKLFNAQLALDADGWRFSGGNYIVEDESGKSATIPSGGNIYQNLGSRMTGNVGKDTHVRLRTGAEEKCRLAIRMDSQTGTVGVKEKRKVESKFSNCQLSDLIISVSGGEDAYVDDVQVYTFMTQGELYNMDGSEKKCTEALRLMNQKL